MIEEAWKKIGYDCHVHLRPHVDAVKQPAHQLAPMATAARERGLTLQVREHAPLPKALCFGPNEDYLSNMRHDEVDPFLNLFENQELPVGFEVDYVAEFETESREIVASLTAGARRRGIKLCAFSGSVHLLPSQVRDFDWEKNGIEIVLWELNERILNELIEEKGRQGLLDAYFDAVEGLIRLDFLQAVSHLDLIRKMDPLREDGTRSVFGGLEDYYLQRCRHVVELAQQHGKVLEINMSGINRPWGRPYLHQETLNYCAELGVGVQVSSDAHYPHEVGQYFNQAYRMLRQAGIEAVTIFDDLKPVRKSIR